MKYNMYKQMKPQMSNYKTCSKCGMETLLETCATCLKADMVHLNEPEYTEGIKKVDKMEYEASKKHKENKKKLKLIKKNEKKMLNLEDNFSEKKSNIYNKMIKSKSHILEFPEKANPVRAKKLLRMSNKDIIKKVYDDKEKDKDGTVKKVDDTYCNILKNYCKKVIANDGLIMQKYKYSKALKNSKQGRIYVDGFGIQSLQKKLRGYLAGEYSRDIDIVNCFPTLMVWLCDNFYPDINITDLKKYVNKREKFLNKYKTNKLDILCWSNRDFRYTGDNPLIKCLDNVFKNIQSALWKDKENPIIKMIDMKEITSTNKKGSLLNRVLGIIENDILQQVAHHFKEKINVPYYDGAFFDIDKIDNEEEFLNEINDFTKDYNIKWTFKEHSTLDIPELYDELEDSDDEDITIEQNEEEEKLYGYAYIEYEDLKYKFEKNHTVIASPLMVCREYTDKYFYHGKMKKNLKYELYSFSSIKDLYTNLYYQIKVTKSDDEGNVKTDIKSCKFIKKWLEDATRRTLSKMDFCPHPPNEPDIAPDNIYNMFNGYKASLPNANKEYDYDIDAEVQRFLDHLKLLVNHEQDSYNYLINYIADLIQKPQDLPSVALLFRSKQGLGKDLMINYIEKIIGEKYVYRTSNLKEVYGDFNPAVKGKLLVQLNEVEGKDGFHLKERLKDSITSETLNINEKNVKQFSIRNGIRFIIFSNNLTPIEIPSDDRRYVIFDGADLLDEKDRESYYNPLFDNLNNEDVINKILEFFMNVDLSDFNLRRHRPITKAYKDIRENCIPALYKFSWDWLNELYKPEIFNEKMKKHKKLNKHLIKSTEFHKLFQSWYEKVLKSETTLNFKTIKPMLENIGIQKKEVRINGFRDYYYIIDKDECITKLRDEQKCGVDEEDILELDDDFEEEEYPFTDDLDA